MNVAFLSADMFFFRRRTWHGHTKRIGNRAGCRRQRSAPAPWIQDQRWRNENVRTCMNLPAFQTATSLKNHPFFMIYVTDSPRHSSTSLPFDLVIPFWIHSRLSHVPIPWDFCAPITGDHTFCSSSPLFIDVICNAGANFLIANAAFGEGRVMLLPRRCNNMYHFKPLVHRLPVSPAFASGSIS